MKKNHLGVAGFIKNSFVVLTAMAVIAGGFFVPNSASAVGGATVLPASEGANISIDTTAPNGTGAYTELSGPTITEGMAGDISVGVHTITLPVGWEFNTSSAVTVYKTNGNIQPTSQSAVLTSNTLTFTITQVSTNPSSLAFIFNNMQVRPTGTAVSSGNMTMTAGTITGVDGNTNFGTLTTVPGVVTKVAFTTQPGGAVYGSNLNPQPVIKTQDQFSNDSANGATGKTVALTLSGAGALLGAISLDIGSGIASFTDLGVNAIGTKQLVAETTGLASITSDPFDITQKTLTATVTANNKIYDGNDTAVVTGADVSAGLVYGDAVTADITGATAIFSDANAENGKTVTATGIVLVGEKSSNYSFDGTGTGTANIAPLEITVTPTAAQNKVYGETDPTFAYTFDPALISPDIFTGALGRVANENVGAYAYTLGDLSAGSNYHLNLAEGTFTITPKPLTVTAAGINREYNGAINATVTLSSSDEVSGDGLIYAYTGASFLTKNAENGKQVNVSGISIGGPKAGNYNLLNTETQTIANITQKPITATLNLNNKTYDGDTGAIYSSGQHVVLHGLVDGDVVTASDGDKAFLDKNVGVDKPVNATGIILGGADAENYQFDGTGTGVSTISARAITVTAVTDTKVYDGTVNSSGTPTISVHTIAAGDTANFIQAYDNKNVGTDKTLTPSGTVTDGNGGNNYAVTFVPVSTGAITIKELTVTGATVTTKVYDGNTVASITGATLSGNINGDTVILENASIGAFSSKDIGNGKTVATAPMTISGVDAGNYTLTQPALTGDITAKELTVTDATVTTKIYDGNTVAVITGATLSGVVDSEDVTLANHTSGTFALKNVGTHSVATAPMTISGVDAGNYTLTQPALTGDITQKTLTVTATGINKVYDGTDAATVTLADDKVSGDILTPSYATATFVNKNVGLGKAVSVSGISISGPDAGNYAANSSASTTADITVKTLTATVTVSDKVYDGTNTAIITNRVPIGVESVDTIVLSGGTATFANGVIGNDKAVTASGITISSGNELGNYSFDGTATGTGNILPIPTVVYVNGIFTGESAGGHTFGYDAFSTIQGGVNAVDVDGTVNVEAGTYAESITIGKDISIIGAGMTTIVEPAIDQNGFFVTADGVTIQNLKINLQTSGVDAQAVRLENADNVTISDNEITTTGNKGVGIWIGNVGYGNSNNLNITGNTITISDESTGIYAERGNPASTGWQITSNIITANLGNPIELYDVTDSTVDGNTFTTTSSGGSNVMWFAELSDLSSLVFSNNIVSGSSGSEVAIGTGAKTESSHSVTTVTITGNTLSNWGSRGLRLGYVSGTGTTTGVTAYSNKFLSAGEALKNLDASQVNVENNWWGVAVPNFTTATVGNVDYDPWYLDEAMSILSSSISKDIISVDDSYVGDSTPTGYYLGLNAFTTIQEGVAAVTSSGTVNVAAGSYTEQVTINKSLDLIGAGEGTTTILAPAVRTGSVSQVLSDRTIIHDYLLGAYATSDTIDVRVEGFTIDVGSQNKTAGTGQIDGVFFRDVKDVSDTTVAGLFSSTIHNFAAAPSYEGFGVVVYGDSLLTLNDNDISDYTRDGIGINRLNGEGTANPNVTISNNTITGTVTSLNGISVDTVSAGAVTGNTVTSNPSGTPWASGGIVLWSSTGVPITGNHVNNNFYGIDLYNGSHDITISGNVLTGNLKRGISLGGGSATNNNTVSGNTITGPVDGTDDIAIAISNGSTGNMIGGSTLADGNTINMAVAGSGNLYAIHLEGSVDAGSNTIKYNTITGGKRAVQFDGPSGITTGLTTITNNTISGQEFGGVTAYNSSSLIITNNTLTNTVRPIEFFGPHDVTISGNMIDGSTFDGINAGSYTGTVIISDENKFINLPTDAHAINNQGVATINATRNWFGTTDSATIIAKINGTVNYRPWCTTEVCSPIDDITPTVTVNTLLTNDTTPTLTGTLNEIGTVTVTVNSHDYVAVVTSGTWSTEVTNELTGGTYSVTATAEDLAGNIGTDASSNELTVDTGLPTLTTVAIASNNSNTALAKVGDTITLTFVASENLTADPVVTILGQTATIHTGSDAQHWTATYVTQSGDTEGVIPFTINFTDIATNTGTQVSVTIGGSSVTFDKTVPAITLTSIAGDNYINNSEKGAIVVVGTAEANALVSVSLTNGATVSGTQQLADGNTDYSIEINGTTLSNGTVTPSVTATDATGNVSATVTTPTAIKDIVAPTITSKTPSASAVGIDPATNITVVFSENVIMSENGAQVTLQKGSSDPVSTVVTGSGTGNVTIDPSVALDNNSTYTITLTGVTDTAGNTLSTTSWVFTTSASYSIALTTGWNLISLPVVPTNTNIGTVLGASLDDATKIETVWEYDPIDGIWRVYHPGSVGTSDPLFSTMTAGEGYWINYLSGTTGTIAGTGNLFQAGNSTPPQKTLAAGWNLIGYYQLENVINTTAAHALSTITGQWTQLRTFGNTDKQFQSVTTMKPGEGYWIFMKSSSYAPYLYGPGDTD